MENILSASDFRVDFSYLQSFFNDIFSHALVIDLLERMIVLFDSFGNRVFNTFEWCFTVTKTHTMLGVVNFAQFWAWIGSCLVKCMI